MTPSASTRRSTWSRSASSPIVGLTNCGPNGNQFLDELGRWALEAYLGIVERDPEPLALGAEQLADYAGTYETVAAIATITLDDDSGGLILKAEIKPETLAKLVEEGEEPPDEPAVPARHPARTG